MNKFESGKWKSTYSVCQIFCLIMKTCNVPLPYKYHRPYLHSYVREREGKKGEREREWERERERERERETRELYHTYAYA